MTTMHGASTADDEALALKGMQLFTQRKYQEAAQIFQAYLRIHSSNAHMWSNFSAALNELNRPEESIAAAREALRLKPDLLEAWNNLGAVLDRSGRALEAVSAYQEAINIAPTSDLWSNQGNAYKAAGQADQAIACYQHAIVLNPANWRACPICCL